MGPGEQTRALVCPGCGARPGSDRRFCDACALPLVIEAPAAPEVRISEARARARQIKPQLAEGTPVKVAWAQNEAEAEFIQGLLLEEGVPSMLRRSAGFDVPDMLAAGPRDIIVPQSGVDTARQVLLQAELIDTDAGVRPPASGGRLLVGLLLALAVGALIIWLVSLAIH